MKMIGTCSKTSVWWDIENCEVPKKFEATRIAISIAKSLFDKDFWGPISIFVYGDIHKIPASVQEALSSTGVALNHVPSDAKDAAEKKIIVDMLLWAVDNPPPANVLLISGDEDFANALHQLRMRTYTILLAQPIQASPALVAAAKHVWHWKVIIEGGPTIADGGSIISSSGSPITTDGGAERDGNNMEAPEFSEVHDSSNQTPSSNKLKSNTRQKLIYFAKPTGTSTPNSNSPVAGKNITSVPPENISRVIPDHPSTNAVLPAYETLSPAYMQGLVTVILLVLDCLKEAEIIPSKANILDLVQHGVQKSLEFAVEKRIIMLNKGGETPFYSTTEVSDSIGSTSVDVDMCPWDAIRDFLSSSIGCRKIKLAKSRYEAAILLKDECLPDLSLGEALEILDLVIKVKKWIILTEWQARPNFN